MSWREKIDDTEIVDALNERNVPDDATPDQIMAELFGWHLGDTSWWHEVKHWMTEVDYEVEQP